VYSTHRPRSYQTANQPPCLRTPPLHSEKRRSTVVTHYSRRRPPWHVIAMRWSPVILTADANNGRTRRRRWTHLSGTCLLEADRKAQIWRQKIEEKMKFGQNAPPTTRTITTTPHRMSQNEPPVREREKEKPTQKLHCDVPHRLGMRMCLYV
jgi:hypothetical protein